MGSPSGIGIRSAVRPFHFLLFTSGVLTRLVRCLMNSEGAKLYCNAFQRDDDFGSFGLFCWVSGMYSFFIARRLARRRAWDGIWTYRLL